MTIDDLTQQQRDRLHDQAIRNIDWFNRLLARLKALKFPTDDRLYAAAIKGQDAAKELLRATSDHPQSSAPPEIPEFVRRIGK